MTEPVLTATVATLRPTDVPAAAALHSRAFPGFFLSSLGEPFLREFYAGFAHDPDAVTVVSRDGTGRLVGVVVGTVAPDRFYRRLLRRRGPWLARAVVGRALRDPRAAWRLLRGLTHRGAVPVAAHGALLASICVDPTAGQAGHGRLLIERWWRAACEHGATSAYLTTDADDNDRVNRFYRRAGWTLAGAYVTREGRRMNCYTLVSSSRRRPPAAG
ncbi:GNAT family N-acetyltransferase [Micromonospora sp. WMMD882]|uniref:GNAT family N-acetyltransferase n=1 Tax=Micromonospora sp. WMMD882 TaxID=3015151 RepID=UPI00248D2A5C|nr:GNAT family N-acetyltransferase [Micromonospora sp. WMMD882]WBB81576.1 GNAT family N-acetyltransferase [Micromonospora sp. WMMD882]